MAGCADLTVDLETSTKPVRMCVSLKLETAPAASHFIYLRLVVEGFEPLRMNPGVFRRMQTEKIG